MHKKNFCISKQEVLYICLFAVMSEHLKFRCITMLQNTREIKCSTAQQGAKPLIAHGSEMNLKHTESILNQFTVVKVFSGQYDENITMTTH